MKTNIIYQGDALTKLKEFPNNSINCVMTSPPYWALRDYSVEGQLGLEPTFEKYIKKLCNIFDEVKRVLRDDGTCWVNLGDTYYGGGNNRGNNSPISYKQSTNKGAIGQVQQDWSKMNYKSKCLIMIPQRFAIEMVNHGWILRNTIIWHKPNCMPSSVKDRFTVDFEYVFFFSKKKKYYFERQLEPHTTKENRPDGIVRERTYGYNTEYPEVRRGLKKGPVQTGNEQRHNKNINYGKQGRNKRTVWTICPQPFSEAHFAVYPEELCEIPIKSGCPEFVCVKCGNPKKVIHTPSEEYSKLLRNQGKGWSSERRREAMKIGNALTEGKRHDITADYKISFKPDCNCNAGFTSGIVLDPFFGAGTTGLVALKQNKKFIGIELNKDYIEIAKKRLKPFLEQTKLI